MVRAQSNENKCVPAWRFRDFRDTWTVFRPPTIIPEHTRWFRPRFRSCVSSESWPATFINCTIIFGGKISSSPKTVKTSCNPQEFYGISLGKYIIEYHHTTSYHPGKKTVFGYLLGVPNSLSAIHRWPVRTWPTVRPRDPPSGFHKFHEKSHQNGWFRGTHGDPGCFKLNTTTWKLLEDRVSMGFRLSRRGVR